MRKAYDKIESKTAHNHLNLDIIYTDIYIHIQHSTNPTFNSFLSTSKYTKHFINPRAINFKSSMNGVEVLSKAHNCLSIFGSFLSYFGRWVFILIISLRQTKQRWRWDFPKTPKQNFLIGFKKMLFFLDGDWKITYTTHQPSTSRRKSQKRTHYTHIVHTNKMWWFCQAMEQSQCEKKRTDPE